MIQASRHAFTSAAAWAAALLIVLPAGAALAWQPSAPPSKAVSERIKRDAARCKSTENLETCDDAVRWDPSDPALLVAFGDALMRAQHPADALRQYQRAVALAPKMPGVGAKISAAEARLPKHAATRLARARGIAAAAPAAAKSTVARNAGGAAAQPYTNDAAESHSH